MPDAISQRWWDAGVQKPSGKKWSHYSLLEKNTKGKVVGETKELKVMNILLRLTGTNDMYAEINSLATISRVPKPQ